MTSRGRRCLRDIGRGRKRVCTRESNSNSESDRQIEGGKTRRWHGVGSRRKVGWRQKRMEEEKVKKGVVK